MATLDVLQDRIEGIGTRLQAENESLSEERMSANLTLDFSRERPGSERRPKPPPFAGFNLPGRPNTISARPRGERPRIEPLFFQTPKQHQDSPELNAHVKEISRKKGIITINGKTYRSTIEDMKYISELGNGTSGSVVKMCHEPSSELIAVKQMHRSGNLEEAKRVFFDLEVVLKSHDCPCIVQCLGCFVTDTDVWICMELMSTCLDKLVKKYKQPFPEEIIGKIAVATVKALHYLKESHGVIHRDVKPSNILLDNKGNIKLCDFGISGRLVDSKANTRSAGCAAYMAPERIDPPDPSKPDYDIRADVWSLGITLVELATGQFPYKDCKTDFEVLTKVLQDAPPLLPPESGFSQDFRDFVKDCLEKDYKQRPKYKRLLEYPFIKKYEKKQVDIVSWFADVSRVIEGRPKIWPPSLLSPLFSRNSRPNNRPSNSTSTNETTPCAPPIAPRRRSRTPDSRCQDRFPTTNTNKEDKPKINHVTTQMKVPASPILGRAVSSSPARSIPPASPGSSRAFSVSPVPRSQPLSDLHSSYYLSSHSGSTIPHHQYGVLGSSHSYTPKPYSPMHSQYSNPYSQVLPSRPSHNTTHNCGSLSSSFGDNRTAKPVASRFGLVNTSAGCSNSTSASSSYAFVPSITSNSQFRKTPEPVSRYPPTYLPPHVSPLVSRRIVESRAALEKARNPTSFSSTSGPRSLPSTVTSPHYRYNQEANNHTRPYYTPEPQRRIFPPSKHP